MELKDKIESLSHLGQVLEDIKNGPDHPVINQANSENQWFTRDNIEMALVGAAKFLNQETLEGWISQYAVKATSPKRVGVIMAGNIPLVGFHDLMCVLLSGHHAAIKTSSKDNVLIKHLVKELINFNTDWQEQISFPERLNDVEAVIATGSDNTSRYFEYYFKSKPHIIRKNRTSIGVLEGKESKEELQALGRDIFAYFGLGCRNVSKIFVPEGYDLTGFMDSLQDYAPALEHSKYKNNYDYNKAIYLVNGDQHFDTGFLLLRESQELVSPTAVLFYEYYQSLQELTLKIEAKREKLQCIVSSSEHIAGAIPFGQAQLPEIDDYADSVDTMRFLTSLS